MSSYLDTTERMRDPVQRRLSDLAYFCRHLLTYSSQKH
jgi:hypothetical protein